MWYDLFNASVAELVDALDLGSNGFTRESSSLSTRTKHDQSMDDWGTPGKDRDLA